VVQEVVGIFMGIFDKNKGKTNYDDMSSRERDDMIRRLEGERQKVNSEIESILRSYSRESGNRTLKRGRRKIGGFPNDWSFAEDE